SAWWRLVRLCWDSRYYFLVEMYFCVVFFFFFSSRRRHTRWPRDWSSDVCSSDLISHSALVKCRGELGRLERVRMTELELSYLDGLREVMGRRKRGQRLLLLFLGSTIGNFEHAEAHEFLKAIRAHLAPGDALLLGTDLV